MSTDPFSHPWLSGLFSAPEIKQYWSAEAQIKYILRFEIAWTKALSNNGIITSEAADVAFEKLKTFKANHSFLKDGVTNDGVVIPTLVRELREGIQEPDAIHTGTTSQDVIDTALSLTLNKINAQIIKELEGLCGELMQLSEKFGEKDLVGRTRMQNALTIKASHRFDNWMMPIAELIDEKSDFRFPMQIGGAVGDNQALGEDADKVLENVAASLNLDLPKRSWHTNRNMIVSYANWLARVSGALGKVGQDIALMAQMNEIGIKGAGTSSAMPHKQNPISAELLVTLARYNAGQSGTITQSLVHEQERSGSAWMLEWMILPQMTMVTGCSIQTANHLISNIVSIGNS